MSERPAGCLVDLKGISSSRLAEGGRQRTETIRPIQNSGNIRTRASEGKENIEKVGLQQLKFRKGEKLKNKG